MIGERLTGLLPEKAQPYAKVIFGAIILIIGLLVSLTVIDDETGAKIVQAVTALAALLGVYEIPNARKPALTGGTTLRSKK